MRGAFVIRLGPETNPSSGHFEGCIEEVDSGKELKFQSSAELLKFLGERFQVAFEATPQMQVSRTTREMKAEDDARTENLDPLSADSRARRR